MAMKLKKSLLSSLAIASLFITGVTTAQADNFDLTVTLGDVENPQQTMRVSPGSHYRIDTYLKNNGPDAAPGRILVTGEVLPECPYLVGWYLSADPIITTDDIQIGQFCPNGLQPGQILRLWADIYIPLNIEGGIYYYGAIADYNQSVMESDETNNIASGSRTVVR
jgi:hypothetical protein